MPAYDPYDYFRTDIFTVVILVGAIQGVFLFTLLISKPHRQPYHYLLFAALALACALIQTEIFLGYSGLLTKVIFLADFSEPLVFIIGPLLFLLMRALSGEPFRKKEWLHFIPFVLYFIYHLRFLAESDAVKFNSFLWAFHPELPLKEVSYRYAFDPLYIRRNLELFISLHMGIYLLLSFVKVRTLQKRIGTSSYFMSWIRILLGVFLLEYILYLAVRFHFIHDVGDHFSAVFITVWFFLFSYKMLTDSGFFQPVVRQKYEKSTLSAEDKEGILHKLKSLEETEFYTEPSLSLPKLAKQLGTTPHYLSQVINEEMGKTFFDYIGKLRVEKAKRMLKDPETLNFKIEEIAERSGYLSKSAFSATFKKITGHTPGKFRKSAPGKSTGL
ncbi:AraC family transcriptional regulator [Sinomicrobium pectinilyticum]|uniref:AraC family transcriptional regulator n=1 Tax=Sinomicrobium pectinilyticum TaxID=1084421 RepID=A0A3N0EVN2_SINP1|nr:helix-turn-helix transcriptional regulator [Sinomicrobium pectinilyticum]RNL91769.1 AraC family transcriptional regulator [Sinomicrobium pectinilyticum]